MDKNDKYFLNLITSAVADLTPTEPPADIDWQKIYSLVKNHSVFFCFYYAVKKLSSPPSEDVMHKLDKIYFYKIKREIQKEYITEKVIGAFERDQIPTIPLKGYFIRNLYPAKEMRFYSDLDIYCEDQEKAVNSLRNLGFTLFRDDEHHYIFTKNKFAVELHKTLFVGELKDPFLHPFEHSTKYKDYNYIYNLNSDYFYAYFTSHAYYHFIHGGFGVRTLMDFYFLQPQINSRSFIEILGLKKFESVMSDTAHALFENLPYDEDIIDFILISHTNGEQKNRILIKSLLDGKSSFLKSALFPDFDYIKRIYKIKKRAQLPYYWIKRWFRIISSKRTIAGDILCQFSANEEEKVKIKQIFEKMGIKD